MTVAQGDASYKSWLGGKTYMAPVSPWFSTHYGPEVLYSKNFVFPSGPLWYNRWQEILTGGFNFVEIITWNDIGESHYVGVYKIRRLSPYSHQHHHQITTPPQRKHHNTTPPPPITNRSLWQIQTIALDSNILDISFTCSFCSVLPSETTSS